MTATWRSDPEYVARERARKQSPEYLDKQAAYNRARLQDPEYRERQRIRRSSPEYRERENARRKESRLPGESLTPEQRRERKLERKRAYRNRPEVRERERARTNTPEYRERASQRRAERIATDPAYRDRWYAYQAARRARKRGARVDERFSLDEIYERDRARCHICRRRCKRADATMDHLIPIALDGLHTRANVALACRSCNSGKGTRAIGEQLALC